MHRALICVATAASARPSFRSDSRYVVNCGAKWIADWKRRGWKRKEGLLKNVDLLRPLDELVAPHDIEWKWVRGHAGEFGNERVDALANQAMDRLMAREPTRWERRCAWKEGCPGRGVGQPWTRVDRGLRAVDDRYSIGA